MGYTSFETVFGKRIARVSFHDSPNDKLRLSWNREGH